MKSRHSEAIDPKREGGIGIRIGRWLTHRPVIRRRRALTEDQLAPRRESGLDQGSLARLLTVLNTDRDQAGVEYCRLLRRLTEFFRRRGEPSPAEAADQTLDRIAVRLSIGERIDHLERYSMRVARFVGLERYRRRNREREAVVRYWEEQEATTLPDTCEFSRHSYCLSRLAKHEQSLLFEYYRECMGCTRFQLRRELASRLGISISQLRLRVHRLCRKLELIRVAESSRPEIVPGKL